MKRITILEDAHDRTGYEMKILGKSYKYSQ